MCAAGCRSTPQPPPELVPRPLPLASNWTPPARDPVEDLIERSQQHLEAGEAELDRGHLDRAREAFDTAVDLLLEFPDGARVDPRIRDHFDELVDRISDYEIAALAKGNGVDEHAAEPASIDALLAYATFPPVFDPRLEEAIRSDLERTAHDLPIPLNGQVLRYVELFQGRLHGWFTEGLQRGGQYLPMIQTVFREEGLPLDLSYVPLIESAFKPTVVSRARAKGLWQFTSGTGLDHGLKQDWYIDERADPEKATRAAARYLRTLFNAFDGDWHLALASYNGGPNRVLRAQRMATQDDFWSLAAARRLPRETREYVPAILAAVVIARNPAEYGFTPLYERPAAYERVPLATAVDLRRVAEWSGASIDEIRALNPELRRWTTPLREGDYEVKVPTGTSEMVRLQLSEAGEADLAAVNWYTVRKGETLATIARALGVRTADLAQANYLTTGTHVQAGQRLIVPREPTRRLAVAAEPPATIVAGAEPALDVRLASNDGAGAGTRLLYRVKRGDTLYSIARAHDTTVSALKSWNTTIERSRIRTGDRLVVFTRSIPAGDR